MGATAGCDVGGVQGASGLLLWGAALAPPPPSAALKDAEVAVSCCAASLAPAAEARRWLLLPGGKLRLRSSLKDPVTCMGGNGPESEESGMLCAAAGESGMLAARGCSMDNPVSSGPEPTVPAAAALKAVASLLACLPMESTDSCPEREITSRLLQDQVCSTLKEGCCTCYCREREREREWDTKEHTRIQTAAGVGESTLSRRVV
jgi:hypothetical protein